MQKGADAKVYSNFCQLAHGSTMMTCPKMLHWAPSANLGRTTAPPKLPFTSHTAQVSFTGPLVWSGKETSDYTVKKKRLDDV